MLYQVSKEFQRGSETYIAKFSERTDAEAFLRMKHEADQLLKINVIYRLYERAQMIEALGGDAAVGAVMGPSQESSAAAGGKGSGSTFSPTPFNMAPRPGGMPHNWVKDEDKKEDSK